MSNERYYWKCGNSECGALNYKSRKSIEASKERGEAVILRCLNCGYLHGLGGWKFTQAESKTWLPCIAFEGPEARLTIGTASGGLWKDANGVAFTRDEYMEKYKIDPEINWKWRQNGKPRPRK